MSAAPLEVNDANETPAVDGAEPRPDGIGAAQEGLVFQQSDDIQGNTPVVSIVDRFSSFSVGVKVTDVSWSKDDMEVSTCVRDTITNRDVECISQRDSSTHQGDTLLASKTIVFDKGRNAYSTPGDFSPGTEFGLRLRMKTYDGTARSTSQSYTCTWGSYAYDCEAGNAYMGVGQNEGTIDERSLALGNQSSVKFRFEINWLNSTITERIPPRQSSAQGNDGAEWHHFEPPMFLFGRVGGRLTLESGSGDADLYGRVGSQPTLTTWGCRPYKSGTTQEECILDGDNYAHFSVRNYSTTQEARYRLYLEAGGIAPII